MGAGVSTEGAPLSEVAIKNEIGVLYDAEKKKAFDAAATEGTDGTRVAAWPTSEAHAKEHDERALDPRKCMFHNLKAFKAAREQIDEIARVHIKGDVKKIPWVGKNLGDECRQCGLDGEPAASLDALYEVAALARVQLEEIMTAACPESGVKLMFAPLSVRPRPLGSGLHADEPRERVRRLRRPGEEARHAGACARDPGAGVRRRPRASGQHAGEPRERVIPP
mgnify:CR=1 FL=1